MKIEYYLSEQAHEQYFIKLKQLAKRTDIKKVCDVGGGANPLLSLDLIEECGLEYTLLDISAEELAKAPDKYRKIHLDITDPSFSVQEEYDLVITKFLAEHISNAELFHRNVYSLLKPGGYAFHYFPTLYNLPYLTNLLLSENLSYPILLFFQPIRNKDGKMGKFPAYYKWCLGPTKSNIKRFNQIGYSIEEYIGFFGHGFYERLPILKLLDCIEKTKARLLMKYPLPSLTQFAHVLLKK